jgi:hypothetical protein
MAPQKEWAFVFRPSRLTLYALRSKVRYALCALRFATV